MKKISSSHLEGVVVSLRESTAMLATRNESTVVGRMTEIKRVGECVVWYKKAQKEVSLEVSGQYDENGRDEKNRSGLWPYIHRWIHRRAY